jgi:LysM repeat protein
MRKQRVILKIGFLVLIILVIFSRVGHPVRAQAAVPTPLDLINTVNELRASFGLPPLAINSSLMTSAQSHANYQASLGTVTHYGADGSRPYNRALAAGYGGGSDVVISENIAVIYGAVDMHFLLYNMWADEAHWNTMTKPTYKDIGAGVSQSDGRIFLTIDVGWIKGGVPATAGQSSSSNDTSGEDTVSQIIMPVEVATPLPDGTIIHLVMPGQAMWSIAIAYKVKIVDIANLNHMSATDPVIYSGQELLIQPSYTPTKQGMQATPSPGEGAGQTVTPTATSTIIANKTSTPTPTSLTQETAPTKDHTTLYIILVIAFGLVALIIVSLLTPKGEN